MNIDETMSISRKIHENEGDIVGEPEIQKLEKSGRKVAEF